MTRPGPGRRQPRRPLAGISQPGGWGSVINVASGMMKPMRDPFRRVRIGLVALALVLVAGTTGYLLLGFDFLDSVYQTVTTVTTVGFTSPHALGAGSKTFTIVLILVGVGTALYTFSAVLEVLIEGHMRDLVRRRKMERDIARMSDHVIVCGWGRVGREVARFLVNAGRQVVVIDRDASRLGEVPYASVHGDVTDDEILARGWRRAGGNFGGCPRHRRRQPLCDSGRQIDATRSADHRPGPQ